jgi:hypothetical protein
LPYVGRLPCKNSFAACQTSSRRHQCGGFLARQFLLIWSHQHGEQCRGTLLIEGSPIVGHQILALPVAGRQTDRKSAALAVLTIFNLGEAAQHLCGDLVRPFWHLVMSMVNVAFGSEPDHRGRACESRLSLHCSHFKNRTHAFLPSLKKGRSYLIVCKVEGLARFKSQTSYTLSDGYAAGQIKSCSLKKLQRKKK